MPSSGEDSPVSGKSFRRDVPPSPYDSRHAVSAAVQPKSAHPQGERKTDYRIPTSPQSGASFTKACFSFQPRNPPAPNLHPGNHEFSRQTTSRIDSRAVAAKPESPWPGGLCARRSKHSSNPSVLAPWFPSSSLETGVCPLIAPLARGSQAGAWKPGGGLGECLPPNKRNPLHSIGLQSEPREERKASAPTAFPREAWERRGTDCRPPDPPARFVQDLVPGQHSPEMTDHPRLFHVGPGHPLACGDALSQHADRMSDLFLGVVGGDEKPQSRCAFRHRRVENRPRVDTAL